MTLAITAPELSDAATDDLAVALAPVFKASGDSLRVEILRLLQQDSFGVLELCDLFSLRQSAMSHHLKVLANAGLVSTQREGNSIFYRRSVADPQTALGQAVHHVFQAIDGMALSPQVIDQVTCLKQKRAENSRAFFAKHAAAFKQQQELIAEFSQYAEPAHSLIEAHPWPQGASALELGPGEGAFLPLLSQQFSQVYALDNSEDMLRQAQYTADRHALGNVRFLLGDIDTAIAEGVQVDLLVLNMVLHHLPSPADVFSACNRLLKPGGRLFITDLCKHSQNWVKDACGDLWLGFDSADFAQWQQLGGLFPERELFVALRNGFQIQVREFVRPAPSIPQFQS